MTMASLEKEILADARVVTKNPKLKMADIMEWSTGKIKPQAGENLYTLPSGINIAVLIK